MKSTILVLFCIYFIALSCSSERRSAGKGEINQGIKGYVKELIGDQMPSPDRKLPPPTPVKTTVYIFPPTNLKQVSQVGNSPFYRTISTKLIKTVETDKKGYFTTDLPEGQYSLFTKVNDMYYANALDSKNNIQPVTVKQGEVTEVNITLSSKATF